jgi:hypothetical protein
LLFVYKDSSDQYGRYQMSDDLTTALITIYSSITPSLVRCKDDASFPEVACIIAAMFSRLGFRTVIAMAPHGKVRDIERFKASKFPGDRFQVAVGWRYLEDIHDKKATTCDVLVVDARRRIFPEILAEGTVAGTSLVLIDTEAMLPPEKPALFTETQEFLAKFGRIYDSSFFKELHDTHDDNVTVVDILDSIPPDTEKEVADVVGIVQTFLRPRPLGPPVMFLNVRKVVDPAACENSRQAAEAPDPTTRPPEAKPVAKDQEGEGGKGEERFLKAKGDASSTSRWEEALRKALFSRVPLLVRVGDAGQVVEVACALGVLLSRVGLEVVIGSNHPEAAASIKSTLVDRYPGDRVPAGDIHDLAEDGHEVLVIDARARSFVEVASEVTRATITSILIDLPTSAPPEKDEFVMDSPFVQAHPDMATRSFFSLSAECATSEHVIDLVGPSPREIPSIIDKIVRDIPSSFLQEKRDQCSGKFPLPAHIARQMYPPKSAPRDTCVLLCYEQRSSMEAVLTKLRVAIEKLPPPCPVNVRAGECTHRQYQDVHYGTVKIIYPFWIMFRFDASARRRVLDWIDALHARGGLPLPGEFNCGDQYIDDYDKHVATSSEFSVKPR